MSVYRDTVGTVTFTHPIGTDLTATVKDSSGTVLYTSGAIPSVAGVYTLDVPWTLTEYDVALTITWSDGGTFSRTQNLDVVTPILSLAQLKAVFVDSGEVPTDAELFDLEQAVRAQVETFTRQSFGYSVGTQQYVGNGGKSLALKQRLVRLDSFDGGWFQSTTDVPVPPGVGVSFDGYSLTLDPNQFLTVKESPPIEFMNYVTNGVIQVPDWYIKAFNTGATFTISGVWGWSEVPYEVQEAAKLLVNDYASLDVSYRDRYLDSVKIQQDTWLYNPGAYRGTGNARADMLLGKYRRSGMVII
jgi:hypothetical protein